MLRAQNFPRKTLNHKSQLLQGNDEQREQPLTPLSIGRPYLHLLHRPGNPTYRDVQQTGTESKSYLGFLGLWLFCRWSIWYRLPFSYFQWIGRSHPIPISPYEQKGFSQVLSNWLNWKKVRAYTCNSILNSVLMWLAIYKSELNIIWIQELTIKFSACPLFWLSRESRESKGKKRTRPLAVKEIYESKCSHSARQSLAVKFWMHRKWT